MLAGAFSSFTAESLRGVLKTAPFLSRSATWGENTAERQNLLSKTIAGIKLIAFLLLSLSLCHCATRTRGKCTRTHLQPAVLIVFSWITFVT